MYIELHARSAFSFLEGASVPEEMAEVCAQYQMPAMALLDRDGVYGAPRFYLAAKKFKIQAHIGAEITCLLPGATGQPFISRIPLLCTSREGYQNLCRLITRMKLRAPKIPAALPQRKRSSADDENLVLHAQAIASISDLAEYFCGLV
jgi:error-prone DNA polymerase